MARSYKTGIDYFSHDVDMMQDTKIKIIKAKHGLIGYAVYLRLLEEVYRDKGYYLKQTEDFTILFCDDNNLDLNVYNNIVNDCINKELFNKYLFNEYNILTSKRIQQNFLDATKRRKHVEIISDYFLHKDDYILDNYDSEKSDVIINELNVNINGENDDIKKQSKEKGKGNKKKEDKNKEDNPAKAGEIADFKKTKVPYNEIVDLYNQKLGDVIPSVRKVNTKRKRKMKVRWNNELDNLEKWEEVFDAVKEQSFCLGDNSNGWNVTFDWLIKNDNNFVKVLERQYQTKKDKSHEDQMRDEWSDFING